MELKREQERELERERQAAAEKSVPGVFLYYKGAQCLAAVLINQEAYMCCVLQREAGEGEGRGSSDGTGKSRQREGEERDGGGEEDGEFCVHDYEHLVVCILVVKARATFNRRSSGERRRRGRPNRNVPQRR